MILNAYAVLAVFLSVVQLLIAAAALGAAAKGLWSSHRVAGTSARTDLEVRGYFAITAAVVLLAVNVVSWPLLFLLLQSYVPEWRGVMCVYGVMQIGTGSLGSTGWLPLLVRCAQLSKPAIVFAGGCVWVLYNINRRTPDGGLLRRVLGSIVCLGMLSILDASLELGYLAIPKQGEYLSVGCCTLTFDAEPFSGRFGFLARDAAAWPRNLTLAYYALNLGLIGMVSFALRTRSRLLPAALGAVLAASLLDLLVSTCFLIDVAAPRLLRLPYHHCPYDLLAKAPESLLSMAAFIFALFAVGWSCVAAWLGHNAKTHSLIPAEVRRLLRLAVLGWLGSMLMMTIEMVLA